VSLWPLFHPEGTSDSFHSDSSKFLNDPNLPHLRVIERDLRNTVDLALQSLVLNIRNIINDKFKKAKYYSDYTKAMAMSFREKGWKYMNCPPLDYKNAVPFELRDKWTMEWKKWKTTKDQSDYTKGMAMSFQQTGRINLSGVDYKQAIMFSNYAKTMSILQERHKCSCALIIQQARLSA
jgi:hypothetical protein